MLISRDGSQTVQPPRLDFPLSPPSTSFVVEHGFGRRPNTVTVLADRGGGRLKVVHPTILFGPAPAFDVTIVTSAPFTGLALLT
ncbi:hypothetical protein J7643_03800 [bacterium]|nr:hypothetical protein [bacterium]